jgi:hypothetical protein
MSANFGQTNTCGGSLAADGECTINVIFAPTATGTLAGTLTITDNSNGAAGSTQTVALLGTGTAPMAAGVVSPAALAFGNQGVDIPSTPHPVTLQNVSSISLSITSISVIGANPGNFSLGGTCGATLAAETTCQINVIFDPTAAGRRRV